MNREGIMKQTFVRNFLLPAALIFLAGCSITSPFSGSGDPVTFSVRIDADTFSPEANLRVRIWAAEQLEIAENTANCAVSYNADTQTEELHCPDGVVYQQPTPEEFEFLVQNIGEQIEIRSASVTVGEMYRLQISGLASDDCNTTSASVEEKARSAQIVLQDLMWATTMMACP